MVPLGPGLAVGRSARADGVQDGDEAVGARAAAAEGACWIGRGESAAWSWQAPCMQAEAATDKGGGQSVARKPDVGNRRVQDPHAPPAIAGRRIASRHHARGGAGWQANYFPTKRAFESRPPMHGGAVTITCCCSECQRVGQCRQNPRRFWHCRIAWKGARAWRTRRSGTSGTESSEPSVGDARRGKCDSARPSDMCDRSCNRTAATPAGWFKCLLAY